MENFLVPPNNLLKMNFLFDSDLFYDSMQSYTIVQIIASSTQ